MISAHHSERIRIVKNDGQVIEGVRALLDADGKHMHIRVKNLPRDVNIDDGDILERLLPNDKAIRYTILDAGYRPGHISIPARYICRIEKVGLSSKDQSATIIYNLSGNNSRLYQGSIDNSTNNVQADSSDQLFNDLINAVSQSITDNTELLAIISEMKGNQNNSKFISSYQKFMTSAADHMTVITPFLPALSRLLG